ncbi:hypothetical protein PN462_10715 [Spirulina sp. CS-785/01]|uniref:hypothetical protein n=1 Tax=Spirulina sp. CS-785/01 TaxID=3021716 RepID=UPI00232B6C46|nr:hypothetical protein [Spirulina sp. CS-785/01]MDB9313572.1 hypothetical protein [Spirulina sp. CS-785/01]
MPKPFIGVRISSELHEAIATRMRETGESKSDIVVSALKYYLGLTPCHQRLEEIEQRLAKLEQDRPVSSKQ